MKRKIKWGIIGLGNIANKFASDLALSENAILHAVASRDLQKAQAFSKKYNSTKYYGSYEELSKDKDIEVVYIATPHSFHFQNSMMCLKNGKSVLCEKPLGIHSDEVRAMIKEATSRNLFLMEALWTRFIPGTEKLIQLLKDQVIGEITSIKADFGFKGDLNLESRVYNKKLAGGSLLDIGIYPIYLSLLVLGIPTNIKASARMTQTGVDSFCSMLFEYDHAAKAMLESTIEEDTPIEASIYGTKGMLKLHRSFHHTEKISLFKEGELKEVFNIRYKGEGYFHEIEEVNNCLDHHAIESSKLPHSLSLDLITLIDQVKDKIGLNYK